MALRLVLEIGSGGVEPAGRDRSQIVSVRPAQPPPSHAVSVGDAGAGALEFLDQPRDVHDGAEPGEHVHVVGDDARGDDLRPVSGGDRRQEPLENPGARLVEGLEAVSGGPGDEDLQPERHEKTMGCPGVLV